MKIGILTWHYYQNFGSALQTFALQTALKSLGHKVSVLNYRNPKFGNTNLLKENICYVLAPVLSKFKRFHLSNLQFRKKYMTETRIIKDKIQLTKVSSEYNTIVFGSDQIWAPNLLNTVYLGDGIANNIPRISYAASIGLNEIPDTLVDTYITHLSKFKQIGIRESEGKQLLYKRCNLESTVVLDPTLLIPISVYERMQREVKNIKGPYVFCYFLNRNHEYKDSVIKYAKTHNLKIVGVSDRIEDETWMTRLTGLGADHFLWLINHSETVFTDSYHGSIFSLLFRKNFWIFVRFSETDPICQNSRIRQLSENFNLYDRVINSNTEIEDIKSIDYSDIEKRLLKLRNDSLTFLQKALLEC